MDFRALTVLERESSLAVFKRFFIKKNSPAFKKLVGFTKTRLKYLVLFVASKN